MITPEQLQAAVAQNVLSALQEDIGDGDITAQLIPESQTARAIVIARESGVLCGVDWVNRVFQEIDPAIKVNWTVGDGDTFNANEPLFDCKGSARGILTAERCALNFLQLLSGTASICRHYADIVEKYPAKLLDTRKTIPGLRIAQKYAVTQGGCFNHRIGLYDAFLIKENHIAACGSIAQAIANARSQSPGKPVEVEVEDLAELEAALSAKADIIMLDNFSLADMQRAVETTNGQAKLEASGGILEQTLAPIAETGVDYISIGALTKDCKAIDLSMRFN